MAKKRKIYRKKGATARDISFHERFQITLGIGEIKKKFVNRLKNQVFDNFFHRQIDLDTLRYRIL